MTYQTKTILIRLVLVALASGLLALVIYIAALVAAALEPDPHPTGCAGRNPPSSESVERGGCGRTAPNGDDDE